MEVQCFRNAKVSTFLLSNTYFKNKNFFNNKDDLQKKYIDLNKDQLYLVVELKHFQIFDFKRNRFLVTASDPFSLATSIA